METEITCNSSVHYDKELSFKNRMQKTEAL